MKVWPAADRYPIFLVNELNRIDHSGLTWVLQIDRFTGCIQFEIHVGLAEEHEPDIVERVGLRG